MCLLLTLPGPDHVAVPVRVVGGADGRQHEAHADRDLGADLGGLQVRVQPKHAQDLVHHAARRLIYTLMVYFDFLLVDSYDVKSLINICY